MPGAMVTCCSCKAKFPERALGGSWLDRRCPTCSARLSEEAYDAAAAELLAAAPPDGTRMPRALKAELKQLAYARYYTSEWFQLACAGQGSAASDKGLFGLRAFYRRGDARFRLEPADQDRSPEAGWGISAEYRVFDCLRAEVARPGSPLSGARLVPNLTFPWIVKPKQWGARHRSQLDCLLLCRSCAVTVEVKRREHHIKVSRGFGGVRERTEAGSFKSAKETLDQMAQGAASFEERQQLYPPERIFRMLVYVDAISFDPGGSRFDNGLFVGHLDGASGSDTPPDFVVALRRLVGALGPVTGKRAPSGLAAQLMDRFGNTLERRSGRIVRGHAPGDGQQRRSAKMLDAIRARTHNPDSALYGAHLVRNVVFEAQVGRRGKKARAKKVHLSGLLLTRTHALLIGARRWRLHVNTHAPFATVYVGDPKDGAKPVHDGIRHDWDLESIHYVNRSGSLSMLEVAARGMTEIDRYRARNRVCTLNVFVDPLSFFTDRDDFRSRTFAGYWRSGGDENIIAPLERLVSSAQPVMKQAELDRLAQRIAGIGA